MHNFSLIHISDLHLCANKYLTVGEKYDDLPLQALADFLKYYETSYDRVIISGDLADSGTVRNLDFAYKIINSDSSVQKKFAFPKIGDRLFLMPGNHDRYNSKMLPLRSMKFDKAFAQWWKDGNSCQPYYLPQKDGPQLSIICADFSLRDKKDATLKRGRWGQGKVYTDVLDELTDLTIKTQRKCPVIWMVHFAPKFANIPSYLTMLDHNFLIEKAEKLKVKYILCGHTHIHHDYNLGTQNDIQVFCSGSATILSSMINKNEPHFYAYKISVKEDEEILVQATSYKYDKRTRDFAAVK